MTLSTSSVLVLVAAVTALQGPAPAPGGQAAAAPVSARAGNTPSADAYYQFMLGRRLEGEGDVDAAIGAFRRAADTDPQSAEIRAELAALYARQNRAEDAIAAAEQALALDPDNGEAHAVLGGVYAARAQAGREMRRPGADAASEALAIQHLAKARAVRGYDVGLQLTLGRLHFARGEYAEAASVLTDLVEREPGANEAMWLLAQSHVASGRRDAAIATLENAVAAEPRFTRALLSLAELYERERRWKDAAAAYARAADQNPRAGELRVRQATALLSAGEPAQARDLLQPLVAANPGDAAALFALAEAQRTLRELDAAEATARQLIAAEPDDVRGPYALALVLDDRHDTRGVVATLEPVVTRLQAPDQKAAAPLSPLLVRLAYAYQGLGDHERALRTFERARALSPDPAALDPFVAQAHLAAGRPKEALALVRAARKARPDDSRLLRLEAEALHDAGRTDEAVEILSEHASGLADDLELQLALGTLLAESGRLERALPVFDDAERRFPDRVDVVFRRGAALEQARRYEDAEAAFRRVLALDPQHAAALNYLGYMLVERGERLDEGTTLIERALELDPGNPSYLDSLGWAWFKRGDLRRAKEYLAPAAEQLPTNSVVHDHLGDLLLALGDRAGAVAAWERALAGDGETIDAEAIRKKIAEGRRAPE